MKSPLSSAPISPRARSAGRPNTLCHALSHSVRPKYGQNYRSKHSWHLSVAYMGPVLYAMYLAIQEGWSTGMASFSLKFRSIHPSRCMDFCNSYQRIPFWYQLPFQPLQIQIQWLGRYVKIGMADHLPLLYQSLYSHSLLQNASFRFSDHQSNIPNY